ncbi:acyl-CoA--6-aminopenicillanic acid acyltransferase [Ramlibacter sp. G-1-2-2]|uniref:Acyl-CoA--6-aminopenicillanic acid acyltransferase n=1 Tax=Ramlibacter agri TaxID=2728837 RepID=A0A848HB84_9BURK|nr:C45 family peptidase [Ramlibacter agri]NML47312.1 acyl-CoA--6-aminopenicillanic acid acyltransferase [Ramlibacter agri]
MTPPFPLITLTGGPRERGLQYGRQARDRIHRSVSIYGGQIQGMALGRSDIEPIVQAFLPKIEAFDPAYVEEMRGIAEGAGLELSDVAMINARTEILRLAQRESELKRLDQHPDGCTGAILLPSVTASGRLLHGQNWDWRAECAESTVVLKIRREDGPDILTMTEAGGLARCGLNSAGIAVTANYLSCDRDYTQAGVPLALLRRKVLETEHVALALRTVYATPKSASNNLMVSHAGGFGLDIECAPDESFLVHPVNGMLVHANHWQSPVALGKLRDTGIANSPDSLYRDVRVRQLLEADSGKLGLDHLRAAFFDDFAKPWSVCRPPRMTVEGNMSASVAMVLMDPAAGRMEVAPLPALNREFTTYSLDLQ